MVQAAKILVVDDEAVIRLTLKEILIRDGYQVVTADSGQSALKLVASQEFDLVLVDLKLGDIAGIDVLMALRREAPQTIVIMLTGYASLETAVEALRQGAHDYLFKPCQTVELRESIRRGLLKRQHEMRQRNLLRQLEQNLLNSLANIRATATEPADAPSFLPDAEQLIKSLAIITGDQPNEQQGRFLQRGELIVDLSRHLIILANQLLELSPIEFGLLAYLISEAPRVISPQELVKEVQGYESEQWEASETVRSHIYHIRQKIKQASGRTNIIRTVRGVGYTIDE
jgi:DNA-binding response OmpR family regulator